MRTLSLFVLWLLAFATAVAGDRLEREVLVTPHHRVTVRQLCEEGEIGCNLAGRVHNLASHRYIELHGTTIMVMCADGVTPCHVGFYRLKGAGREYLLYPTGELFVKRHGRLLLSESGSWKYVGT
jgi:hypothetical protein